MNKPSNRIMSLQDSLKELMELGSPVDWAGTEIESDELLIEQVGGIHNGRVFELEDGRAGYTLQVCITNRTLRPVYVRDLELRLPWEDQLFDWLLPDTVTVPNRRTQKRKTYDQYRFPGRNGLELPLEDVLNHLLMPGMSLSPRHPLSGWLLATGGPIPRELFHGGWMDSSFVIVTSDKAEHCCQLRLWTERLEPGRRPFRPTTDLYGNPITDRGLNRDSKGVKGPEVTNLEAINRPKPE